MGWWVNGLVGWWSCGWSAVLGWRARLMGWRLLDSGWAAGFVGSRVLLGGLVDVWVGECIGVVEAWRRFCTATAGNMAWFS